MRTDKENQSRTEPSGDKGVKSRRCLHVLLIASLLSLHFGLLVSSLNQTSVTVDEASHLAIGHGFLESGDTGWLILNPPFQRALAALPLFFQSVEFDSLAPEKAVDFWYRGQEFMDQNRSNYQRIFMNGRFMVCLLSCFAGLLVFVLGRQVAGAGAGLVSLFLYSLSPAMLAHGGLVTTDLSAALAGLAMIAGIVHYRSKQSLLALVLAGLGFSLLFITKFNALIFLPVGLLLLALPKKIAGEERQAAGGPKTRAIDILIVLSICWLALCAAYLFQGLFAKPSEIILQSSVLGWINVLPDWLRIPLPAPYLKALDLQLSDVLGDRSVYFFGKSGPSFWYFPACLLFKASLPLLVLFVVGVVTSDRRRLWFVVLPAAFFFIVMSTVTGKQMGARMVLPALPFMFVCGGWAAAALWKKGRARKKHIFKLIVVLALAWHSAYALLSYPHYIGAFNEIAGGPRLPHHGHRYLADSNLDWGQDWIRLAKWQEENNVPRLSMAYFGIVEPALYGVEYEPDNCEFKPGHLAVSVNLALGIDPYLQRKCYTVLEHRQPVERIGTSIRIYRINE